MKPYIKITITNRIHDTLTDEPQTLKDIVRTLKIPPPSASTALNTLKKKGLAARAMTASDKPGWIKGCPASDAPVPKPFEDPIRGFNTLRTPSLDSQPLQTYIPQDNPPMQTSTAIQALIQTEQQNAQLRLTLQQILGVYEQLGNLLEAAGLLEA